METGPLEQFRTAFQDMVEGLVGGKRGEGREGGSDSGREGVRSEKSSKTDSESQSSDDSGSESSDDSSPSTNQNPAESHMTKVVVKATEAAQLANQIADLEVYDPGYKEVVLHTTLSLFCEIVTVKDRLHEAQLLQEVGHVMSHDAM